MHGSVVKTDRLFKEIKLKSQTEIHTSIKAWFLIKKPETHTREKKASSTNDSGLTGGQHLKECKYIHVYHPTQ